MTIDALFARADSLNVAKPPLAARIAALKAYVVMCLEIWADKYAAAAAYEGLSGMSDAQLHRRGLSRDTLARDIAEACDRRAQ
jgi:hypothetical protein